MQTNTQEALPEVKTNSKSKKKWLKIFIYTFLSILIFLAVSWVLTALIGIKMVENRQEAFFKSFYERLKEQYEKDPAIAHLWAKPQKNISPRMSAFWRQTLLEQKRFPGFEEWLEFRNRRNSISNISPLPFIIESKYYHGNRAWREERHFWYFWDLRTYKHKILIFY
jgi:hypothetical protein